MSAALGIMDRLKGEVLLGGSHILTQIEGLKEGLQYKTDGTFVSFDDHFIFIQGEIDKIPRIALKDEIPAQQGGRYENELLSALEEIQDQVEKWTIKATRFLGDLNSAKSDVSELSSAFESWYFIAAVELLSTTELKLPNQNIKALAISEFNRLMNRSNLSVDAIIEAVKIELKRLDSKRKMARQKFEMGREQVNAAWANKLPESLGHFPDAPRFDLLQSGVIEDEPEGIPAYVSRDGSVKSALTAVEIKAAGDKFIEQGTAALHAEFAPKEEDWAEKAQRERQATMTDEELFGRDGGYPDDAHEDGPDIFSPETTPLPTFCGVCNANQYDTPSGPNCPNGHGGAEELDAPRPLPTEGTKDGWGHSAEDATVEGLARDMNGMMDGTDRHQQVMATFEEQEQKALAVELLAVQIEEEKPIGVVKEITAEGEIVVEMKVDDALALVARSNPAAKANDFDDFDDADTPAPGPIDRVIAKNAARKAAATDEIKGTFKKTGTPQPVTVIEEATTLDLSKYEISSDPGGPDYTASTIVEVPETAKVVEITTKQEIEPEPTKRKAFDFDDFDVEEPVAVSAPEPAQTEPVKTDPEPSPVVAAVTPAATPRKSTQVFDFDDDELS